MRDLRTAGFAARGVVVGRFATPLQAAATIERRVSAGKKGTKKGGKPKGGGKKGGY